MKRGKNEKVWFCLEAGWKIWYDYGKAAGREEEIRRANDLNGQLSQLKRKELQRIQSQSGSIRVSMVYLTMVQEAQNVVTYIINLMKVSRKFQMETEMP